MTTLFFVLGVFIVLGIAIWVLAATRPKVLVVRRSRVIHAPPESVFPLINNFHLWRSWSPYERLDPEMRRTFSGPASGVGAGYAWEGNRRAGSGRMEITASQAPERIGIRLEFNRPMKAVNTTEFVLARREGGTEVTWSMQGASPLFLRLMGLWVDFDRLLGKDFELGLEQLQTAAGRQG